MGAIHVHAGHTEMRIGRRIAVTRKVFSRGHHSAFVRALDVGGDQIADLLGIFANERVLIMGFAGFEFTSASGRSSIECRWHTIPQR